MHTGTATSQQAQAVAADSLQQVHSDFAEALKSMKRPELDRSVAAVILLHGFESPAEIRGETCVSSRVLRQRVRNALRENAPSRADMLACLDKLQELWLIRNRPEDRLAPDKIYLHRGDPFWEQPEVQNLFRRVIELRKPPVHSSSSNSDKSSAKQAETKMPSLERQATRLTLKMINSARSIFVCSDAASEVGEGGRRARENLQSWTTELSDLFRNLSELVPQLARSDTLAMSLLKVKFGVETLCAIDWTDAEKRDDQIRSIRLDSKEGFLRLLEGLADVGKRIGSPSVTRATDKLFEELDDQHFELFRSARANLAEHGSTFFDTANELLRRVHYKGAILHQLRHLQGEETLYDVMNPQEVRGLAAKLREVLGRQIPKIDCRLDADKCLIIIGIPPHQQRSADAAIQRVIKAYAAELTENARAALVEYAADLTKIVNDSFQLLRASPLASVVDSRTWELMNACAEELKGHFGLDPPPQTTNRDLGMFFGSPRFPRPKSRQLPKRLELNLAVPGFQKLRQLLQGDPAVIETLSKRFEQLGHAMRKTFLEF